MSAGRRRIDSAAKALVIETESATAPRRTTGTALNLRPPSAQVLAD